MIIDAKELSNGLIECRYETHLECANCGMEVDALEYSSGTCSDCGSDWDEKRHIAVHVTSIPLSGQTF